LIKSKHDASASRPASLDLIAARFSVERVLDTEGPCLVVAATHLGSGEHVVVKLLRPELAVEPTVTRFLRAARQAATVESAHVVRIVEADRVSAEGPPYLAMERLKGGSLAYLLMQHGPLRLPAALEMLLQACEGLSAAHGAGVVHGHLKPAKLFRAQQRDGSASIKLLDLGLAVALAREASRGSSVPPGEGLASPEYRSPEQVAGSRRVEVRADLWGLGLVLYQLLTGRHPFAEATTRAALAKAVASGPPSLGDKVAGSTPQLEELLRHCLHKDASQRPADVASVAERLRALLAQSSAVAATPAPARSPKRATPVETPGKGRGRRLSSPGALRPRFMGPALGNRAAAGGSYRLSGKDAVTEEVVLPRSRRRPRPEAGAAASSRRRPQAESSPKKQEPARESDGAAIERLLERERQTRIQTDPATPRALGPERRRSKPPAAEAPTATQAAGGPEEPRLAPTASARRSGPPAPGPDPRWRTPIDDDIPVIEISSEDADGPELLLDPGTGTWLPGAAGSAPDGTPDSWELDLPPSPEPPETTSGPRSGPRQPSIKPAPSAPAAVAGARAEVFGGFVLDRCFATTRRSELFLARPASGSSPAPVLVVKRAIDEGAIDPGRLELIARQHRPGAHPNLCAVYQAGQADGFPFLALELVDGVDARSLMGWAARSGLRLPVPVVAYLVRRAAAALAAFHGSADADGGGPRPVHGDVRPSKLYLAVNGDVKLGPPALSVRPGGGARGKFDFQAPEELAGERIDPSADLFALGVVLGELLIGEPIFPGKGIATLLALHQLDTAPLHRRAAELPASLLAVCDKALARLPSDRFANAGELGDALADVEAQGGRGTAAALGELVARARAAEATTLDQDDSTGERVAAETLAKETVAAEARHGAEQAQLVRVRRAHSGLIGQLGLAALMEAVATGNLGPDDEVTWDKTSFVPIWNVERLARHLLLSAPSRGKGLLDRKAPDHVYLTRETPMLDVLAQMRQCSGTGLLLAEQLEGERNQRTEICLLDGRLHSVRSSDPAELLGEHLVARGTIHRAQLNEALAALPWFDGRVGDALVGLGLVDAGDAFRAIRDQACDRVAATFGWQEAKVHVYLSYSPPPVPFPVDLDLSAAMIRGVLVTTANEPASLLPGMLAHIEPGARPAPVGRSELAAVPVGLRLLASISGSRPVVAQAIRMLENQGALATGEACAAIVVARSLRWITIRAPGS
jgi:serine/threonine protein kinase